MNNLFKILIGTGLAIALVSCGTGQSVYGNNSNNYPNNGSVYRTADGQVYRRGDIYRDQNGNVYQNGRIIRSGDIYGQPGILGRNGNQNRYYPNQNRRNLPPGQAKKIYGGSAKDYAKGQQNKRSNQWKKSDNDHSDRRNRNDSGDKRSKNSINNKFNKK